jgi:DNA polymerase I-like protein with 3'-5' exonuclease and polymerase domains/uracil-DNA glycosylase
MFNPLHEKLTAPKDIPTTNIILIFVKTGQYIPAELVTVSKKCIDNTDLRSWCNMDAIDQACLKCRRWEICGPQAMKVMPTVWRSNPAGPKIDVLFIVPSPDRENGLNRETFTRGKAAELFHKMVSRLEINYAVMGVALCGGDEKVTGKQAQYCKQFVEPLIAHMDPGCMVLMGEAPRDSLLDSEVSISAAHKHVFKYKIGEREISCLIAPDPFSQFFKQGAKDLRPVLGEVYEIAAQIVAGTYVPLGIGHWGYIGQDFPVDSAKWKFRNFVEALEQEISIDMEWDTSNSTDDTIWEDGKGGLVTVQSSGWNPTAHRYETMVVDVRNWEKEDLRDFFKMAFLQKIIVGSFLKIDLQAAWVNTADVQVGGPWDGNFVNGVDILNFCRGWEDGHYIVYLQDQSLRGSGLKPRCMTAFGWPDWSVYFNDALKQARKKLGEGQDICSNIDLETLYLYAATDAYGEIKHWREVGKKLVPGVQMCYDEMKETTRSLLQMERVGLKVDVPKLQAYQARLEGEIAQMQIWLNSHPFVAKAGLVEFNAKSGPQVTAVCRHNDLRDKKGNPVKETETGLAAVNKDTLPWLTWKKPELRTTDTQWFFGVIWDQRRKRDMISRSILPFLRYQTNGWCHPLYSPSKQDEVTGEENGTVTSRNVATNPNALAMPKDPEYLECFPAPEGHCIVERDYKTGEPCINAFMSQCPALMNAFLLGAKEPDNPESDVYRVFMASVLNKYAGDLDKPERDAGKVPWLAGTYGQGPEAIAEASGITTEEAEGRLYAFYSRYPELLAREAEVRRKLFNGETFITAMGRRRTFPLSRTYPYDHARHRNYMSYQLARELKMTGLDSAKMRESGNNEIQNPLALITFYALNYINRISYQSGIGLLDCKPFLTVHDSIKFYIPDDELLRTRIERLGELMSGLGNFLPEQVLNNLKIPKDIPVLRTDWKIGESLGTMVEDKKALEGEWEFATSLQYPAMKGN